MAPGLGRESNHRLCGTHHGSLGSWGRFRPGTPWQSHQQLRSAHETQEVSASGDYTETSLCICVFLQTQGDQTILNPYEQNPSCTFLTVLSVVCVWKGFLVRYSQAAKRR